MHITGIKSLQGVWSAKKLNASAGWVYSLEFQAHIHKISLMQVLLATGYHHDNSVIITAITTVNGGCSNVSQWGNALAQ